MNINTGDLSRGKIGGVISNLQILALTNLGMARDALGAGLWMDALMGIDQAEFLIRRCADLEAAAKAAVPD